MGGGVCGLSRQGWTEIVVGMLLMYVLLVVVVVVAVVVLQVTHHLMILVVRECIQCRRGNPRRTMSADNSPVCIRLSSDGDYLSEMVSRHVVKGRRLDSGGGFVGWTLQRQRQGGPEVGAKPARERKAFCR